MIELDGEWTGFYKYGEGYSELQKRMLVPFNMIIVTGIIDFVGKIIEDELNGGIDDEIIVRGKLENDVINFVKFYTKAHYFNENDDAETFDSDTHTKVYYNGKYSFEEKKFKGEWIISEYLIDNDDVLQDFICKGEWEIWKK